MKELKIFDAAKEECSKNKECGGVVKVGLRKPTFMNNSLIRYEWSYRLRKGHTLKPFIKHDVPDQPWIINSPKPPTTWKKTNWETCFG